MFEERKSFQPWQGWIPGAAASAATMPQGPRQVKQNRAQYRDSSRYCAHILGGASRVYADQAAGFLR
jgi:hypothetical protein